MFTIIIIILAIYFFPCILDLLYGILTLIGIILFTIVNGILIIFK